MISVQIFLVYQWTVCLSIFGIYMLEGLLRDLYIPFRYWVLGIEQWKLDFGSFWKY